MRADTALGNFGDAQQRRGRAAEDAHWRKLRGAETVGNVHLHRAEVMQPLDAGTVDAAVSDQCAGTRQADLAAVGVAG